MNLFKQAYNSRFLRSATVLTAGSFAGLAIPLILLPVFTRIYSAELYGIQGILFVGMMALVPLATGYFDWAIPTPKKEKEARGLASLAAWLALAVSIVALNIIHFAKDSIIDLLRIPEIGAWIYAYPIIVFTVALANIANYWLLRTGAFGAQGGIKIVGALATAALAYGAHLLHIADGLLVGCVGGFIIAAIWGVAQMIRYGYTHTPPVWERVKRYRHFPLYGSIPTALYNLAAQIPLLIITATYTLHTAGHYAVTRNILFVGVNLIALCVGQVLLKHIAELTHAKKRVWPYFIHLTGWLTAFGICLMVGVYVVGPWFFRIYLGAGWEDAASITRILAPATFFWLIGPTLSQAVIAVHKIKMVAMWQVMYGLAAPALFLFTALPYEQFLMRYVAFEVIAYTLFALMMIRTMRRFDGK